MNTTHVHAAGQDFPALRRSFRRANRAAALKEATTPPHPPHVPPPDRKHAALEELTEPFRRELARKHAKIVGYKKQEYRTAIEAWEAYVRDGELVGNFASEADILDALRKAKTGEVWHGGRENGQKNRFPNVLACGTRTITVRCGACGDDVKQKPEGCGVRRVCDRCDVANAQKRRARFGRGRARNLIDAHRYQLDRAGRPNGRYTEKMLTLTIPHATLAAARAFAPRGEVAAEARDDLHARIVALHKAWPRFVRRVNRYFQGLTHTTESGAVVPMPEVHTRYHRAFEWTPGADGAGHPHFHVYVWSVYLPKERVAEWWADALRAVGWPVEKTIVGWACKKGVVVPVYGDKIRIDVRVLHDFDLAAARELIKGGRRQALTLSRVEYKEGPGLDAFDYADGWTIGDIVDACPPAVVARLYMALEGRRLSQASRGFFVEDPPAECPCCGGVDFEVSFKLRPLARAVEASPGRQERGPPQWQTN